ncbi:MAG: F0F1 ATP synthase subunit epsilon [Gammaproteobacteria bacterium]|nr:F0F1 ATP synthase subunit epsilon [Gammaproteobacteria bacterium]
MAETIKVDIVSAEKSIYSGEAAMVFAPASQGEVGIAPGHSALLTKLGPGEVRLRLPDGKEDAYYVSGGILEVQPYIITVLSDTALRAHDIDEAAALKAKEEAEKALHDKESEIDYGAAQAALAEAVAQIETLRRMRNRAGRG